MGISKFISKVCVQDAVYWASPVNDGYGGKTYAAGVPIKCRWENKTAMLKDAFGKEVRVDASILVTQDLDYEGVLWLGLDTDLDDAQIQDPRLVDGAAEIAVIEKIPMIKSTTEFVRKVWTVNLTR